MVIAADAGEVFARDAHVTVKDPHGVADPEGETCRVTLHYDAEHPLAVESTVGRDPVAGTYATLEDCEADLAEQRQLFERFTGLKASFAYCSHPRNLAVLGELDMSNLPIALHIEGYGAAQEHVYTENVDLESPLLTSVSSAAVASALASGGMHVAQVAVQNAIDDGSLGPIAPTLKIRYYAPARASFDAVVTWNESDQQCVDNLDKASRAITSAGVTPFFSYCSGYDAGASYAGAFVYYIDNGHLAVGETKYANVAACDAVASSRLDAVCTVDWDGAVMYAISAKR
jgi:hypothetical protein